MRNVKIDRRNAIMRASALGAGAFIFARNGGSASAQATPDATPTVGSNGLQSDGTWVFTDDRDRVVSVDHLPERIYAETQAALSLFEFGLLPVGTVGYADTYEVPEALAAIPFQDLGAQGSEFDVEAIAALTPDLFVGITWDFNSKADFGGFAEDSIPGFTELAPSVCILGVVAPADASVRRFAELAAALGAEIDTPEIAAAEAAYEAAAQAVRDAAAAKPGLKVLAISPTAESLWIGNPTIASDLVLFSNLGVEFIIPDAPDEANTGLFQELSWEQAAEWQADLYLVDNRPFTLKTEDLLAQPTFGLLPAAAAGQLSNWTVEYITTYAGLTTLLESLATAISSAEIVTG